MTRITTLGAAFALLVSSTALAQTNPPMGAQAPIPPAIDQMAPSAEAPLMPGNPQPGAMEPGAVEPMGDDAMMGPGDMAEDEDDMDADAMDRDMAGGYHHGGRRAGHGGPRGKHAGRGHRRYHHGMGWDRDADDDGAVFRFQQEGGPSFRIKCAAQDTTLECASAIMPMLERLMPAQPAGSAGR